jgi:hypothetical protein
VHASHVVARPVLTNAEKLVPSAGPKSRLVVLRQKRHCGLDHWKRREFDPSRRHDDWRASRHRPGGPDESERPRRPHPHRAGFVSSSALGDHVHFRLRRRPGLQPVAHNCGRGCRRELILDSNERYVSPAGVMNRNRHRNGLADRHAWRNTAAGPASMDARNEQYRCQDRAADGRGEDEQPSGLRRRSYDDEKSADAGESAGPRGRRRPHGGGAATATGTGVS